MQTSKPKILVIGAYGFIGAKIVSALQASGFDVTGLGRNEATAKAVLPDLNWHISDLAVMTKAEDWQKLTSTHDIIINCAGALQDGGNDNLDIVHIAAVQALADACAGANTKLIQISAVGATLDANTPFMRTKAQGDEYIRQSGADYIIFRPGLVLAKNAYGGSALLRMLASIPLIQPVALADAKVQSVSIHDVTQAIILVANGNAPSRSEYDLVEQRTHTLADVISATRNWLGFKPAKWIVPLPNWTTRITAKIADGLAHFGWRSPLRSSAMRVLENGILGDPKPWTAVTGDGLRDLSAALSTAPAAAEDRLFARMSLLMPIIIFTLSLFWLLSGVIGIWQIDRAAAVLTQMGWPDQFAKLSVGFWSVIDIALGMAILFRNWAKQACWGMVAVSMIYLASSAIITPDLWSAPLGPMIKVLPAIILALVARISLDNR